MKNLFLTKTRWLVTIILLTALGIGNARGEEGDELAICQGTGSGYGTRRTLTDSHSVGWVLATGQSGYLGANSATNHDKVKPTAADLPVVKGVKSDATTNTQGYYFYYTSTAISNVGSVVFYYSANSGNSNATAYLLSSSTAASSGSATWSQVTLKTGVGEIAQGVNLSTSGTFTFNLASTETGSKYYGIVIVTSSYKRMTAGTITIKEGATGGSGGSDPTITKSSDFSAFGYSSGSPVAQSFTVSGTNLTANLVVTAPSNYEVCKTANGTYGSSVSFTPSTGSVSDATVYIRLQSGLSAGNYNYTSTSAIRLTSTGATEVDIAVNGMVPYTINWETNSSNHTTTYVDYGGTLTLPNTSPSTSCGGRVFVGWYEGSYSHATDAPTFAKTGDAVTGSTTHTFNAVYAMCDDDSPTSITSFATGDYYLIAKYSTYYYAMDGSTTSGISAVDVTSSVTYNSESQTITVNPGSFASTMVYTISGTTSAAYIKQGLADVGNTSSTGFGTGSWAVTEYDDNTMRFSGNSRCIMFHNDPIFKNYATSNANKTGYGDGSLYLVPVPTYSDFTTTCAACAEDPTTGTAALKGAFSLTSVGVTATGWAAGTNCSWVDYGFVWSESVASPTLVEATGNAATNCTKVQKGTSGTATTWDDNLLKSSFEVDHTYKYRAYGKNGKEGAEYKYSAVQTFTPRQVSFSMHDHGDAPSNQIVANGTKASNPGDPSATGWTFLGWWDNSSYTGSAWDFSTNTVSGSSVTLHAKWQEKPKYTITLNAGNGTVSAAGWTAGDSPTWTKTQSNGDEAIEFPSASCNCAGWEFVGWATSAADNAGSDPTSKAAGDELVPASNVTYYAVYRQSTPGGTTYTKIATVGELKTGNYVITGLYNGTSPWKMVGSLKNDGVNMNEASASVTDNALTESTALNVWTIMNFGSYVAFRNTNTGKFLAIVDGKFALQDDGQKFTYSVSSGAWTFTSPSGKQIAYASTWVVAESQTRDVHLFKQNSTPSGNYYTSPSCTSLSVAGIANPVAGGTVELTATAAKSGDKVWACYTADEDYNFSEWTKTGTGATLSSTTAQFTELTVGSTDATVTANFVAKEWKTVTWMVNGAALSGGDLGSASVKVENGYNITAIPPTPTSCETGSGKSDVFMGWSTTEWSGYKNDDEFPDGTVLYASASVMPAVTDNVIYYACWAQEGSTPTSYTLDFAIAESVNSATAFSAFKTGLTNAATNNTYWDADNITAAGIVYQDANTAGQVGPRLGSGSSTGTITMPLLTAGQVAPTSITVNAKRYGSDASSKLTLTVYYTDDTNESKDLPSGASSYLTADFDDYTANFTSGKTINKIVVQSKTSGQRLYLASITVTANAMEKYLTKCCNTPTLAFAASPYAMTRQNKDQLNVADVLENISFSSNSSGTITAGTVYKLSSFGSRSTTGGTAAVTAHATFVLDDQTKGHFTVNTNSASGNGRGTYRIAITQAATDEEHGNYCETTVYAFVDVTLRFLFVDPLNGNANITVDDTGSGITFPTISSWATPDDDACHSEQRVLKGWISEKSLKGLYVGAGGNLTRVLNLDDIEAADDAASKTGLQRTVVPPGTVMSAGSTLYTQGTKWYAVWAYEK